MVVFQFEFHPDLNIQDGRGPQIRRTQNHQKCNISGAK